MTIVCLALMAFVVCGCFSASRAWRGPVSQSMRPFQSLHLAYLAPEPYRTIHVEIDVVEGVEPPQETIDGLTDFLKTHCKKPVVVVRNRAIARSVAREARQQVLALQNMRGPGKNGGDGRAAYLYILFYDSSLWDKSEYERPGPYFSPMCPSAVFVDVRYLKPWFLYLLRPGLSETASLGLCEM